MPPINNNNNNNNNNDNNNNDNDNKRNRLNEASRRALIKKVAIAQARIEELEKQLENTKKVAEQTPNGGGEKKSSSMNHEVLRRRIANQIKEMWFLVGLFVSSYYFLRKCCGTSFIIIVSFK